MISIIEGTCSSFWSISELLFKTASYLSPKNIACLLAVSTYWYQHLGSNEVWIKLCPRISLENPSAHFYLTCYPDLMGIHLARGARMGDLKVLKSLCGTTSGIRRMQVLGETIAASNGKATHIWDRSVCLQAVESVLNHEFRKTKLKGYLLGVLNNSLTIYSFDDFSIKNLSTNHIICNLTEDKDPLACIEFDHSFQYFTCIGVHDKIIISALCTRQKMI